jgi:hypothetical protein
MVNLHVLSNIKIRTKKSKKDAQGFITSIPGESTDEEALPSKRKFGEHVA